MHFPGNAQKDNAVFPVCVTRMGESGAEKNRWRRTSVVSTLGQRRRRWTSVETALARRSVLLGVRGDSPSDFSLAFPHVYQIMERFFINPLGTIEHSGILIRIEMWITPAISAWHYSTNI